MSPPLNPKAASKSMQRPGIWVFILSLLVLWLVYLVTAVLVPFRGAFPGPLYPLYTPYHYATGRSLISNIFDISNVDFWMVILGTIVICLSTIRRKWRIAISVPFGYLYGIVLALTGYTVYWSEGPGPYENNSWLIFTLTYLITIALGVLWQLIISTIRRRHGYQLSSIMPDA